MDLEILFASRNQLTGEIPPELGGLTSLTILALGGNQLTGPIPDELGSRRKPACNWGAWPCGGNELTGTIPDELGNLTSLTILTSMR